MPMAATGDRTSGVISPRRWVRLVGGQEVAPPPACPAQPVDVAAFHFPDLPTRRALPAIDAHYISFTLAGSLMVERELGRRVERGRFRPGSSLIFPAQRDNAWTWSGATDELHLYLSPAWLSDLAAATGGAAPALIERFAFRDRLLETLGLALLDDRRRGGAGGTLYRDTAMELIGLHVLRTHCTMIRLPVPPSGLAPARLRRVRELVEERLEHDLSLDDLAAAAGLSRSHFARSFHSTTGLTPYAYLRDRRVARARDLLAVPTGLAVAEVAARCGFRSHSHFGRVFRRATGLTPAEYRRITAS